MIDHNDFIKELLKLSQLKLEHLKEIQKVKDKLLVKIKDIVDKEDLEPETLLKYFIAMDRLEMDNMTYLEVFQKNNFNNILPNKIEELEYEDEDKKEKMKNIKRKMLAKEDKLNKKDNENKQNIIDANVEIIDE